MSVAGDKRHAGVPLEEIDRVVVMAHHERNFVDAANALIDLAVSIHEIRTQEQFDCYASESHPNDVVFVYHWSHLLPEDFVASHRVIGFHTSNLPADRGGSPIQNQILRGVYQSQVCALQLSKELDAGPVFARSPVDLSFGTVDEILQRISRVCAKLMREIVQTWPEPIPQSGVATFNPRRQPTESRIPALTSPRAIFDFIRMLDGDTYPRAFVELENVRIEFSDAELSGDLVEARATFRLQSRDQL